MEVKKKRKEKIQTSYIHRASCQLQLQGRVSKFKLSLTRASDSGPSLDSSQKKNKQINSTFLHLQGELRAVSCVLQL
jgi:hypothetical protein